MTKILICGICGKMGNNVYNLLKDDKDAQVVCGVDRNADSASFGVPVYEKFEDVKENVDVIIDFSSPAVLQPELKWAALNGVAVVIGATGYTAEQLQLIENCSKKIAVFRTANFSLGINLLIKLVKEAAETLGEKFDIEIIEKHHNLKADAPSGTAIMLAESANSAFNGNKSYVHGREGATGKRGKEIGMHAVRGGTIVGEHDVMFAGEDEIVTLSHSARSKSVFAAGAITAAKWLAGKNAGLYNMGDLLN